MGAFDEDTRGDDKPKPDQKSGEEQKKTILNHRERETCAEIFRRDFKADKNRIGGNGGEMRLVT
jgi:hypothetical protein